MSSMGEDSILMLAGIEGPPGKVLVPPQENGIHIQGMHSSGSEFSCKTMIPGYTVVFI